MATDYALALYIIFQSLEGFFSPHVPCFVLFMCRPTVRSHIDEATLFSCCTFRVECISDLGDGKTTELSCFELYLTSCIMVRERLPRHIYHTAVVYKDAVSIPCFTS